MKNSLSKKNIYLKNVSEYLVLWAVGGCIYYGIEVLFRGFSHTSMFILGGLCMQFFTWQGRLTNWQDTLPRQITRCTIFVVSMEFITGIVVNKWYHLAVWDYSDMPLQLWGQICLPFALIFSFLCTMGILLSGYLLHWFYKEPMPTLPHLVVLHHPFDI